jgi:hypothetical protein
MADSPEVPQRHHGSATPRRDSDRGSILEKTAEKHRLELVPNHRARPYNGARNDRLASRSWCLAVRALGLADLPEGKGDAEGPAVCPMLWEQDGILEVGPWSRGLPAHGATLKILQRGHDTLVRDSEPAVQRGDGSGKWWHFYSNGGRIELQGTRTRPRLCSELQPSGKIGTERAVVKRKNGRSAVK